MRRLLGILAILFVSTGVCACSDDALELTERLTVAMQGTFVAPVDADGNAEPRFQNYVLTDVVLIEAGGVETSVYKATEATALKIVNRSQIIYEADLAELVDKTFTSARVSFQPGITGGGKIEDAMAVTLVDPELEIPSPFTVEATTTYRLNIEVQWKNTVTRDEDSDPKTETMTAPSFALDLGKG